jgi:hypothetical protein
VQAGGAAAVEEYAQQRRVQSFDAVTSVNCPKNTVTPPQKFSLLMMHW